MIILQQTRGVLSSNDELALDLPWDKTGSFSAIVGPTPSFTRGSSGTVVGSNGFLQSVGNNVPRLTYDPITLKPVGTIIESGKTNLVLHSEDIAQSVWVKTGSSIASDSILSPSGVVNADKIVENSTNGLHGVGFNHNFSATTFTISFYAKKAERSWIFIGFDNSFGNAWFNIDTGNVGIVNGAQSSDIEDAGNGWWRCSATFNFTSSGTRQINIAIAQNNFSSFYQGDGVSGFYLWGCQIEQSQISSYIPTTTQTRARASDVCDISGGNFLNIWDQTEGTFVVSAIKYNNLSSTTALDVTSGGVPTNFLRVSRSSNGVEAIQVAANGTAYPQVLLSQSTRLQKFKIAFAIKSNNLAASMNGGQTINSSNVVVPNITELNIGKLRYFTNNNFINGVICSVRVYRKVLSSEKLRALSSL
jgi:hypothetical protein